MSNRTLNPDMRHDTVEPGESPASNTLHTALVEAYTANGKEAADAAIKKLREHQGSCLELIDKINGMQHERIGDDSKTNSHAQRDYCSLIEYVVGIGLSCECVIHQMECSRTISENP